MSEPEKKDEQPEIVRSLLDEVITQDFPTPPELDKDGNPKFSHADEKLCLEAANDLGNAHRLLKRSGDQILYVEKVGWHGWTGSHWSLEEGEAIVEKLAHETALAMKREVLAYIAKGKRKLADDEEEKDKDFEDRVLKFRRFANDCGNMKRVKGMLAGARPYVSRLHDVMDKHRHLITVENGTLKLDGDGPLRLLKHNPDDYISKKARIKYDPAAKCPNFLQFMKDVQPDEENRKFLQAFFGYCLTGEVKEQIVVMFHGKEGSNGKSVLMEIISWVMGTYASRIPIAALMAQDRRSGGQATPEIARLPGTRFVTAAEPEKGSTFSDHTLKIISGEDTIQARHLNQGFIDFDFQGKLCISFNTKPQVRGGDEAFWRRVVLVPFTQLFKEEWELAQFPGAKQIDREIKRKMESEGSGILNWMIEGYDLWRENGLKVPEKMRAAVEEYRLETNNVLEFVNEWCLRSQDFSINATQLHNAYLMWAAKKGHMKKHSMTGFSIKLMELSGIDKKRDGRKGIEYLGVRLTEEGLQSLADLELQKTARSKWWKKPADDGDDAKDREAMANADDITM